MRRNWEIKTLNEISDNWDSKRIPITQNVRSKGDIPYYGASGIVDYVSDYLFDEDLLCISEDGANLLARTYPIAFSIRGKTWVNNHAHVLRFENIISQKFVELYLNSIKLHDFVSGMAQPKLNQTMLNKIPIPFPPLSEQQRIVSILDKAFAAIAKAKANAEQNLKNAKELFESYLQNIFENKGEDWKEKTLGDVCSLYQGIAINAKTKHALVEKSELPLLRIKDLKNNTVEQYIDPNNFPKNALVNEEDIIYTRTGSLGLVFRGKRGVLHNNSFKVVPNSELNKDFFFIWLQNPIFKSKIMELALRAAQPDITHAIFKVQEIAIPSLVEQKTIIQKLDVLSKNTKKLEDKYQKKIDDLEELKKSILQKAFAGEFTSASSVTSEREFVL